MVAGPRTGRIRVFLDASVLFAASRSPRGSAHDLIVAGALGRVDLILSAYVIAETRRNLSRKSPSALPVFEAFLDGDFMISSQPPAALAHLVAGHIASKDAPVVAGAFHAGAQFLATYDRKDLLSRDREILAVYGVTVATPDEVLASLP
jgi:predicted nucleic acid-binding protein